MASIEELLAEALGSEKSDHEEKTAGEQSVGFSESGDLDLAEFVTDLAKTAEALEKLAEEMPIPPEVAARKLQMLEDVGTATRQEIHEQFIRQMQTVLPEAALSERIPLGVEEIQKTASEDGGSFLLSVIGRD